MVFITGDIHGNIERFLCDCFPEQKEMTKDDYVIIVGDFGVIFDTPESREEQIKLKELDKMPFTTLFIDGNHENFDRLNTYPIEEWHGGKIHKINGSVYHLMRGQVFEIEGRTFFTFGGASSHDIRDGILEIGDKRIKEWRKDRTKLFRINHISWWKEELPTDAEMKEGLKNLKRYNNKVDYILTHSPYTSVLSQMDSGGRLYKSDILSDYLQRIKQTTDYRQWIFGHMHVNQAFYWERSVCIYEQISRLL